jgi:hypothetical protein
MLRGQMVTISKAGQKYYALEESRYDYNDEMINHEKTKQLRHGVIMKNIDEVDKDKFIKDLKKVKTVTEIDNVNHPDHYTQGEIETIDVIEYLTSDLKGIKAVCIGNFIKYVMRCNYKNGWEDVEKAKWYLNKFMEEE